MNIIFSHGILFLKLNFLFPTLEEETIVYIIEIINKKLEEPIQLNYVNLRILIIISKVKVKINHNKILSKSQANIQVQTNMKGFRMLTICWSDGASCRKAFRREVVVRKTFKLEESHIKIYSALGLPHRPGEVRKNIL